ncbi:MAG TPA: rhodanese-like domain-containing protein [Candidatus Obscuribacterales bacterium]
MAEIRQADLAEIYDMHQDQAAGRIWIDIRRPDEWEEGVIPGVERIALDQLPEALASLDPAKTHVLICRSGARSNRACQLMADAGFSHLINFNGGMQAWYQADYPLEN